MRWILDYLRARLRLLALFALWILIFAVVFSLYDLPVEAVGYAGVLSALALLLAAVWDAARFYRMHTALRMLSEHRLYSAQALPAPQNAVEADYTALISAVLQQQKELLAAKEREQADMLEYYTIWMHQIKTPIAAMRLILQEEDSPRSRELLAQLFRIEEYVQMVLAYLRMHSESTDFVLQEYELDKIVRQAVRKYAPMFIRKKIVLELAPISSRVLTDEKWLCFAIEQLLSNAIKYTDAGSVRIYTEGTDTLVIQDTGIGIAPEDLPRIWEKGFTGYNGRVEQRASGLGLYLVKQSLNRLGHRISIVSQVGIGTTVRIDLHTEQLEKE